MHLEAQQARCCVGGTSSIFLAAAHRARTGSDSLHESVSGLVQSSSYSNPGSCFVRFIQLSYQSKAHLHNAIQVEGAVPGLHRPVPLKRFHHAPLPRQLEVNLRQRQRRQSVWQRTSHANCSVWRCLSWPLRRSPSRCACHGLRYRAEPICRGPDRPSSLVISQLHFE